MSTSINSVNSILDRNHFTEEIDGVTFKLRRITAEAAIQVLGNKSMGIVRGAGVKSSVSDEDSLFLVSDMMPKFLDLAMVEPKLGEVTDAEAGIISMEDLGGFAPLLFNVVFKASGYGSLINFQTSSEGTTEES